MVGVALRGRPLFISPRQNAASEWGGHDPTARAAGDDNRSPQRQLWVFAGDRTEAREASDIS
jgi:hypothetical protein